MGFDVVLDRKHPGCGFDVVLERVPDPTHTDKTRNPANTASIRKTLSLVAEIRHPRNVLGELLGTLAVTQSVHTVGVCCDQFSDHFLLPTLGGFFFLSHLSKPTRKLVPVFGIVADTSVVQPPSESATRAAFPEEVPTRATLNRLTADKTIVRPPIGTRFKTNGSAYSDVLRDRPADRTHSAETLSALLVAQSCVEVGLVRRAGIRIRAEDFEPVVGFRIGGYDISRAHDQSEMLPCLVEHEQHNN